MILYDRTYRLDIAGLVVDSLRVHFRVHRQLSAAQVEGHIDIHGMERSREDAIIERGEEAVLAAGYPGTSAVIYDGPVQRVRRLRESPAGFVRCTLGDRMRESARLKGHTLRTYEGAHPVRAVVSDIVADDLSLDIGPLDAIPAGAMLTDYSFAGPADAALDAALRPVGVSWAEVDGTIRFNRPGQSQADSAPGVELSVGTGLVGSPVLTDEGAEAVALLRPDILLGARVDVTSRSINGAWKPVAVTHEGDSWGAAADWTTTLQLREIATT